VTDQAPVPQTTMRAIHWIQVALGAFVAVAASLSVSLPQYAVTLHAISAGAASLLTVLGIVSPGVKAPVTPLDKAS
jgi:cytochrome b561